MREYDEETLKHVQRLEMGILRDFIDVCKENNLTYFALAGTGIGALRHQGFIPWDDDIDVGLPRKDYEKLLEVFESKYSDKYTIGNAEHFENYPLMTTRIMIKGTKFIESTFLGLNKSLQNSTKGKELSARIYADKNIVIGSMAPNFAQPDQQGNRVQLTDFKGKFVLLDFLGKLVRTM